MSIRIDEEKCTGCKLCIPACPFGGVDVEDKMARLNERCTMCGACISACKFDAIVADVVRREDVEADPDRCGLQGSPTRVVRVFRPDRAWQGEMIEGSTEEQVQTLVEKLRSADIC